MKSRLLVLISLLVAVGMLSGALSYSETYITNPSSLRVVETDRALISLNASEFTATAQEIEAAPSYEQLPPSEYTELATPSGLSVEALAAEAVVEFTVSGTLTVTNNMTEPVSISTLRVDGEECITSSKLYLESGESRNFDISFTSSSTSNQELDCYLKGSWEQGEVEIELDLPITVTQSEPIPAPEQIQVAPLSEPGETGNDGPQESPVGFSGSTLPSPDGNEPLPGTPQPEIPPAENNLPQAVSDPAPFESAPQEESSAAIS